VKEKSSERIAAMRRTEAAPSDTVMAMKKMRASRTAERFPAQATR
jgi:hypothetical protein